MLASDWALRYLQIFSKQQYILLYISHILPKCKYTPLLNIPLIQIIVEEEVYIQQMYLVIASGNFNTARADVTVKHPSPANMGGGVYPDKMGENRIFYGLYQTASQV